MFILQDPKDLQLEPDVSKLKSMKRSVLGRRVVNKIKRPEKIVPTIGSYFCFTIVLSGTLYLLGSSDDCLCEQFGPRSRSGCKLCRSGCKMFNSDGVPERIF